MKLLAFSANISVMTMQNCPVCNDTLDAPPRVGEDSNIYDCLVCGKFKISGSALAVLIRLWQLRPDKRPVLSHFVRRIAIDNQLPTLDSDTCKQVVETQELPSPFEQSDNLIRLAGDNSPGPGEAAFFNANSLLAMIGARSGPGLNFVLGSTEEQGLLRKHSKGGKQHEATLGVALTFNGWRRFDELKRGRHAGHTAFMAMQFRKADELVKILDQCFRPAVAETGFRLMRLDDDPPAGIIDDRMRVDIQSARFIIADLTHNNSGAYWEAGYAEGLGKPVIYTCEQKVFEKKGTHFDTNHLTTIPWSSDNYDDAAKRLKATIRATIPEARREDD